MWVLQADKPSGTWIIMNYWSRAKTWVFRGKQSWVLRSCFVSHNAFTVMCNKGLFDPVNRYRKSQLERAHTKQWKTNVLLRASCTFPTAFWRLCCSQPNACHGYPQSCRAVLLHQPWPSLSIWDCGVSSPTVLCNISLSPHGPVSWSPSKSVVTTGIFNSITRCSDVRDTNTYARALKLGQLLLLSIKDKLNLKLTLPSRQNTSYL